MGLCFTYGVALMVNGLRRISEQTISSPAPVEPTLRSSVERYVRREFANLYRLCLLHKIPIPAPPGSRKAKKISKRRKAAWVTRRTIIELAQTTGLAPAEIKRQERLRTRRILTPETAKTTGEIRWVARVQNIFSDAIQNGEKITWEEADRRAREPTRRFA
jgi:hypothetical protein